jgi:DNA-binding FadR family transcriptional regulator
VGFTATSVPDQYIGAFYGTSLWPEHALLSHYNILSAVRDQDSERAAAEMRDHLFFAHSELHSLVEQL